MLTLSPSDDPLAEKKRRAGQPMPMTPPPTAGGGISPPGPGNLPPGKPISPPGPGNLPPGRPQTPPGPGNLPPGGGKPRVVTPPGPPNLPPGSPKFHTPPGPGNLPPGGPGGPISPPGPGNLPPVTPAATGTQYQPGTLPDIQLPTYTPYQYGNPDLKAYEGYQYRDQNVGGYNQYQYDPLSGGPDFGDAGNLERDLLQKVLANPTSLSDEHASMLKERQKEEALSMQQQMQGQMRQSAAARGTMGGGQLDAANRRMGESTIQNILRGNRDVDLYKAERDHTDRLASLQHGENTMRSMNDRSMAQDRLGLERGSLQAAEGARDFDARMANAGLQFNLDAARAGEHGNEYNSQVGLADRMTNLDQLRAGEARASHDSKDNAARFALEKALSQEGLNQAGAASGQDAERIALSKTLGMGGLDLEKNNQQLNWARFLEQMRQFDKDLAFRYGTYGQQPKTSI